MAKVDPIGTLMDQMLQRGSNTAELLEIIWELICRQPRGQRIPVGYLKYDSLEARWVTYGFLRFDKQLDRLIAAKLVKVFNIPGESPLIAISSTGVANLVHICLLRKSGRKINTKSEICILSFDIPETRRADRLALRRLLKSARFKRIHKSTWVGDPRVVEHLLYFLRRQKLTSYVRIYFGREQLVQS